MGFDLTPRERSWFDAILVLGAVTLGFIVLGFVGVLFAYFGDLIMVFFLAWLLAFMLSPVVKAVTAIPLMTRTGAIFTTISCSSAGSSSSRSSSPRRCSRRSRTSSATCPSCARTCRDPGAVAGAPERARVHERRPAAQAAAFLDNISSYAAQLVEPLQQLAVASLGAIGNLLLVVVLSLYMVADRDRIQAFTFWLVPTNYRTEARSSRRRSAARSADSSAARSSPGWRSPRSASRRASPSGSSSSPSRPPSPGVLMAIPFFGPFVAWVPPVLVAILSKPDAPSRSGSSSRSAGWSS